MEKMEENKQYSAESKGYTDQIYEVRFTPVSQRPEYSEGEVKNALDRLRASMTEKDFTQYIDNGLIRITYYDFRLMLITKSEMGRTIIMGRFFDKICTAFCVDNFRVVSQVNGY